ncbi:concanavalin A-like lectin/glucanase [Leptospira ognonensis]|uniref:concanavalin A-like lectin/glucanase n=1 Tax=Leptospira ognonensis TaxID=2484945 RepID=UPI001FE48D39|nr:concanavalin A-like lectin/glucanase [Leptospira ognonensis]
MDRNTFRGRTPRTKTTTYRRAKALSIFLFSLSSLIAKENVTLLSPNLTDWKRTGAVLDTQAGKKDILRAKENTPTSGEIFLDFEGDVANPEFSESALSHSAKTISVVSSSYISDSKYSIFGKKSAFFSGKRNQIHLGVSGSNFFHAHPEPFTITIPLYLSEQGASSVVLDKTVFIKGKKYGFSLEIEENRLVFYANQLIMKENGTTVSAVLQSPNTLPRKEWIFISIYFDTISNRILLFQNGYQTAQFEADGSGIAGIGFPEVDTSNLILAKSYFGNIDGFHIHKGEPLRARDYSRYHRVKFAEDTKLASHNGSYVTSPVYATKYSHSTLEKWNASMETPKDTQTAVFFRGSNQKFQEEESKGPMWISLEDPKNTKLLPKFKFHQWKIWLRSDPQGKSTPSLFGLNYQIKEQIPPEIPTNFRVSLSREKAKTVCFAWNSNHEREVQENGGYLIYFGVEPDRMIGTIFVNANQGKISTIDGKSENADYKNLKFCADEDTLISNIYITDEDAKSIPKALLDPVFSSRHEKRGALFQEGITYYFKIAAYNRFFDEWEGRDQKSKLSSPLSVSFPKEISQR